MQVEQALQRLREGNRCFVHGDALLECAAREILRASARSLRQGSKVLGQLIADQDLRAVGGEYSLGTGTVDLFDGLPLTR